MDDLVFYMTLFYTFIRKNDLQYKVQTQVITRLVRLPHLLLARAKNIVIHRLIIYFPTLYSNLLVYFSFESNTPLFSTLHKTKNVIFSRIVGFFFTIPYVRTTHDKSLNFAKLCPISCSNYAIQRSFVSTRLTRFQSDFFFSQLETV